MEVVVVVVVVVGGIGALDVVAVLETSVLVFVTIRKNKS